MRRLRCGATSAARLRTVVVSLGAAIAVACGSTVQASDTIAEGGPGEGLTDDGLSLAEPGTDAGSGPADRAETAASIGGDDTPGGDASAPGAPGTQDLTRGVDRSRGTAPASASGARGRGFTAKEIFVGFSVTPDQDAAYGALGIPVAFGDTEAQARAIVKDINRRGGLAGRKVALVIWEGRSGGNRDEAAQSACDQWTQDRPVFAAINMSNLPERNVLASCMAKRETPLVMPRTQPVPESSFSAFRPYLFLPSGPTYESSALSLVPRLESTGYFDGWDHANGRPGNAPVKIGIVSDRGPEGKSFENAVSKALAKQGRSVDAIFRPNGPQDAPGIVLAAKSDNITHVFSIAASLLFFGVTAEEQRYRPRYAVTSGNAPGLLQGTVPKEQLSGSLGVGWAPTVDVDFERDPGAVSSAQGRCRKLMENAGQSTRNRSELFSMLSLCDAFTFLATAVDKGGLSAGAVHRGVEAMGSISPAVTFRIAFPNGRPYGGSAVRDLGYGDACECFQYLSGKNHGM